mmetsp:Transcript_102753/g.294890  ORF Transcript_102753/g.294890 Transcript_102753/m.294890 type:complete len:583 (-) Transcript_102753:174-1922(-)
MDEVVRERREVLCVKLAVSIRNGDDSGCRVDSLLGEDLVEQAVGGPACVRGLARRLTGEAWGMVCGLDVPELAAELVQEPLGLLLDVLLSGLHGQHQADLLLGDARGAYALDGQTHHLCVLLVVRQAHEVEDLLPLRPTSPLPSRVLHLCPVNRLEVGIFKMSNLLRAHKSEEPNVSTHLPTLIHAEAGEEGKRVKGRAHVPQARRDSDEGNADDDRERAPKVPDGHVHVDDLQRRRVRGAGLPNPVLVHDRQDVVMETQCVRARRKQRRVQTRLIRRRDDALVGGDEGHTREGHDRGDDEHGDVRVGHELPRTEEQQVLRHRQHLARDEHGGNEKAGGELEITFRHRIHRQDVQDARKDNDLGRVGVVPHLWVLAAHQDCDHDLRHEVEQGTQQAHHQGHGEGFGHVLAGYHGDHVEADHEQNHPRHDVGGETRVAKDVVRQRNHLINREVFQVPRDRLRHRRVHHRPAKHADHAGGDVAAGEALVEDGKREESVQQDQHGCEGHDSRLWGILHRHHVDRAVEKVQDQPSPPNGTLQDLPPTRLRVFRAQIVTHQLVLRLLLTDEAHSLQGRSTYCQHSAQ